MPLRRQGYLQRASDVVVTTKDSCGAMDAGNYPLRSNKWRRRASTPTTSRREAGCAGHPARPLKSRNARFLPIEVRNLFGSDHWRGSARLGKGSEPGVRNVPVNAFDYNLVFLE